MPVNQASASVSPVVVSLALLTTVGCALIDACTSTAQLPCKGAVGRRKSSRVGRNYAGRIRFCHLAG